MQPDPEITVTFLSRLYFPWHNLERELAWSDPGQDAICHAERFAADDLNGFAERAANLNGDGCNVYFTPALLESGGSIGRARDANVAAVGVLWADLDTADAVRAPAKRYGACEPTCSVMTRPPPDVRLHYYWRLSEPFHGRPVAEGRRLNERIAGHMYADPTCCNPARLLRVPGTVRHPTADKPIGPYLFDVCWFGDSVGTYTVELLEAAFPVVASGRDYGVGSSHTPTEEWVRIVAEGVAKGARNSTAARLFGLLVRKLDPDVAWAMGSAWNDARCSPPLDDGELYTIFDSICKAELSRRVG